MFERAKLTLAATAAACAAAAMIVFALGFALYALLQPHFGDAGAAASVAGGAALGLGLFAFASAQKANRDRQESEHVTAQLSQILPQHLSAIAADRPLVSLAATAAAGFLAARYPGIVRDVLSGLAATSERR